MLKYYEQAFLVEDLEEMDPDKKEGNEEDELEEEDTSQNDENDDD